MPSHAKRNNYLAKLSTGNIIFPVNDDMIFVSLNWDTNIDKEFSTTTTANIRFPISNYYHLAFEGLKNVDILGIKHNVCYDFPDNKMDQVPMLKVTKAIESFVSENNFKPSPIDLIHSKI